MNKFEIPENKLIPQIEEETLNFWKENKIFEKSVEQNSEDNLYVFYDGPPFITGLPHYGHLLGSIAKDIVPRYWTMMGKRVERLWGWDAHGLPIENMVQRKFKLNNKKDIENFGIEKFVEECYSYTEEVSSEWKWYIDKIGRWVDIDNAYRTTDQSYMESVMWAFKQLYEKGLIYEGVRTSLFCSVCGTPVSNFEIAMDNSYREAEDLSIIVKFPVTSKGDYKGVNILAWTTTPWTMSSNRALVIEENEVYSLVEQDSEKYIVGKVLAEKVFISDFEILREIKGKELLGLEYEPPYKFFKPNENDFKVYRYKGMVTMEEGTGVVHSAPGFGEIDTEMGKHYGLTLMLTLDDEGKFISGNNGNNPYEGKTYLETNNLVHEDLKNRNLLFYSEKISHRVPFHDRCDTNLIHRAQNSWFIKVSDIKDKLLENNKDINWVPNHFKDGQFKLGIEGAPDWCISRNRFWATPMPIWESEEGDRIVIESVKELEELSGQKVKDLHRPYIDEITIQRGGKTYKHREEVLDSWMDSGSMPFAQIHYPFENKAKFEKNFPGDYISEYIAQVRAWFYVMHVLSTALFDVSCFKNVVVSGVMAGSDGRKMSKTFGNYTDPKEVLKNYGGDALRLYLMNSPLMSGGNSNFNELELKIKLRNVLNPLWNSAKYFLIYANQHSWVPEEEKESDHVLDKWIKARLAQTKEAFTKNIEAYTIALAVEAIEEFVDDLSRWYVRRSRDRISKGDKFALSTLYSVLVEFSKISAPIVPFMAEAIYQKLVVGFDTNDKESVHLCSYPELEKLTKDQGEILKSMKNTREVVTKALAIRTEKSLKVRQPLAKLTIEIADEKFEVYEDLIKDEVNIKEVIKKKGEELKVELDTEITEDLRIEGLYREMIRKIQDLRKKESLLVTDEISAVYEENQDNDKVISKFGDELKDRVLAKKIDPGTEYSITKL